MAKIGELYYDITAKDSGLAKALGNIKKELKDADNAVIEFTKNANSQKITDAFDKTGRTVEQMRNQLSALRSVWSKISTDDVNGQKRVAERYAEISKELSQLGIVVPKLIKEQMSYDTAMKMSSNTIGEMLAKQKALKEARLNESTTTNAGRKHIEYMNAEYKRLDATLKEYGVKEQRVNETLLGKTRILSQLRNELGMYFSVYAAQRFLSEMIKIRGEYELQQTALSAILGNASEANKLFLQVQELGLKSPFSTLDLISYTKQLSAFKVATAELFDTTKALADISAGVGVDMSRLVLAFGQVRAASVLRGTEVRQFTEAGIPLIDELAKKFEELNGKAITTGEVFDKISARQVPFEMVRDVLFEMTKAGGMFYNMQEIQAETLKGKVENLRDAYEKALNTIGEGNEIVLSGAVDSFRFLITHLDKVVSIIEALIVAYGVYTTAQLLDIVVTDRAIIAKKGLTAANKALLVITKAVNLAWERNPIALVLAGVAALTTAYFLLRDSTSEAEKAQKRYNERMDEYKEKLGSQKRAVDELMASIKDETKSYNERYNAMVQLQEMFPDHVKGMNLLAMSTSELTKLQREYNDELAKGEKNLKALDVRNLIQRKRRLEEQKDALPRDAFIEDMIIKNKIKKIDEDIAFVRKEADKDENNLLNSIYKQGQAWENMPSYIKKVNKAIGDLGLDMKRIGPDVSLESWVSEMKDNYAAAEKTVQDYGGSIADVSGGIVEDARKTIRELDKLSASTGFSFKGSKSGGKKEATTYEDKMYRKEVKLEQEKLQSQILLEKQKIEALEDGKEKRLAIIDLEFKEELLRINKQRDDVLIAYNERNKLKGADRATKANMGTFLPDEFSAYTQSAEAATKAKRVKRLKEERDSAMELKKIMTDVTAYQKTETDAQIADIGVRYDEIYKKAKLAGASEIALLEILIARKNEESRAETNGRIRELDMQNEINLAQSSLLLEGVGMQEYAEKEKLRIIIEYSKKKLELLSQLGDEDSQQQAKLLKLSIDSMEKDLGKNTLEGKLGESLTKAVVGAFKKAGNSIEDAEKKTSNLFGKIQQGGQYAADGIGILQSAFGGLSEEADMAMEAASNIAQGFAQGGPVGGIIAAGQEALKLTVKLITARKEVDKSMIEGYKAYIEVIDELIDEQIKSLELLGLKDFAKGINNAYDDISKRLKATMVLFRETANSGQGMFSHSLGYKANKELAKYKGELRSVGIYQTDIAKMTASQLVSLKQIPLLYAKLPEELRKYIDELDESIDKQKELDEQIRDMIMGFNYSDITSAIVDSLTDSSIDNALDDLGGKINDFIGETVKNILVKSMLTEQITKAVNDFWGKVANKDEFGNIVDFAVTPDDASKFKDDVLGAANTFGAAWEIISQQLRDAGIDLNNEGLGGDTERQGLSKGIATASQESIDALTGGVYAVMDAVNVTRNNSLIMVNSLSNITEELKVQTVIFRELSNLAVKIQANTEYNKFLQYISANLTDINTKGLKLKE